MIITQSAKCNFIDYARSVFDASCLHHIHIFPLYANSSGKLADCPRILTSSNVAD